MQVNNIQYSGYTIPHQAFKGTVAKNAERVIKTLYLNSSRSGCETTISSLKSLLLNSHKDNVFDIVIEGNGRFQAIIKNTKLNIAVVPIASIWPMLYRKNPEIVSKHIGSIDATREDIAGIYKSEKFLGKLEDFSHIKDKDKINREIYKNSIKILQDNLGSFPRELSREKLNEIAARLERFGTEELNLSKNITKIDVYNQLYVCNAFRDTDEQISKKAYYAHRLKVMLGLEKSTLLERLLYGKI